MLFFCTNISSIPDPLYNVNCTWSASAFSRSSLPPSRSQPDVYVHVPGGGSQRRRGPPQEESVQGEGGGGYRWWQ